MNNYMSEDKKINVWQEIISTANNEDPQYSYELFSGYLEKAYQDGVKDTEEYDIQEQKLHCKKTSRSSKPVIKLWRVPK